jgi:exopolysaccharide biosynthesis predicted pyruvyltransferase EpsI
MLNHGGAGNLGFYFYFSTMRRAAVHDFAGSRAMAFP